MNGWIKLHRKIINNRFYISDPTAFRVFLHLLLTADENGNGSFGRFQLAQQIGCKDSAIYKAMRRLSSANMVTQTSNNRFTEFHICKWEDYQGFGNNQSNTKSNNKVTTKSQPSNNEVTHYKNKEIRIKNNNIVETQSVYDLYIKSFNKNPNTYKLTPKRKAKLQARLKDAGKEMIEKAIINTSKSSFHMGDNDRGWQADLDFIIRSYEQVEKLASFNPQSNNEKININDSQEDWIAV